jgi:hypothetical protein
VPLSAWERRRRITELTSKRSKNAAISSGLPVIFLEAGIVRWSKVWGCAALDA